MSLYCSLIRGTLQFNRGEFWLRNRISDLIVVSKVVL